MSCTCNFVALWFEQLTSLHTQCVFRLVVSGLTSWAHEYAFDSCRLWRYIHAYCASDTSKLVCNLRQNMLHRVSAQSFNDWFQQQIRTLIRISDTSRSDKTQLHSIAVQRLKWHAPPVSRKGFSSFKWVDVRALVHAAQAVCVPYIYVRVDTHLRSWRDELCIIALWFMLPIVICFFTHVDVSVSHVTVHDYCLRHLSCWACPADHKTNSMLYMAWASLLQEGWHDIHACTCPTKTNDALYHTRSREWSLRNNFTSDCLGRLIMRKKTCWEAGYGSSHYEPVTEWFSEYETDSLHIWSLRSIKAIQSFITHALAECLFRSYNAKLTRQEHMARTVVSEVTICKRAKLKLGPGERTSIFELCSIHRQAQTVAQREFPYMEIFLNNRNKLLGTSIKIWK